MATQKSNPIQISVTPLTIFVFLFGLCEVVAGAVAANIDSGSLQAFLVLFIVFFPFFLSVCFFMILWDRSHVLYPPQQFESDPVGLQHDAIRGLPALVKRHLELVRKMETAPLDRNVHFELVASLLDDSSRQLLILMHDRLITLPLDQSVEVKFDLPGEAARTEKCRVSIAQFSETLEGTKFVSASDDRLVSLTDTGHAFAEWLIENGEKALHFASEFGEWGVPKERVLAGAEMITEAQDILAKLDAELKTPPEVPDASEVRFLAPTPEGEARESFPVL